MPESKSPLKKVETSIKKAGEKITGFFKGEKKESSSIVPEGMKNVEDETKKILNKAKEEVTEKTSENAGESSKKESETIKNTVKQ